MNASFLTGLPANTFQLFRGDGSPLVGGIISTKIHMMTHHKRFGSVGPFPFENCLVGISSPVQEEEMPSPTYWRVAKRGVRQSKLKKVYYDEEGLDA
jgi:hypothetical protein